MNIKAARLPKIVIMKNLEHLDASSSRLCCGHNCYETYNEIQGFDHICSW